MIYTSSAQAATRKVNGLHFIRCSKRRKSASHQWFLCWILLIADSFSSLHAPATADCCQQQRPDWCLRHWTQKASASWGGIINLYISTHLTGAALLKHHLWSFGLGKTLAHCCWSETVSITPNCIHSSSFSIWAICIVPGEKAWFLRMFHIIQPKTQRLSKLVKRKYQEERGVLNLCLFGA